MKKKLKHQFIYTVISVIFFIFALIFILFIIFNNIEKKFIYNLVENLLIQTFEANKDDIADAIFEKRYEALEFYSKNLLDVNNVLLVQFYDENDNEIKTYKNKDINLDEYENFKKENLSNNFYVLKRGFKRIIVFNKVIDILGEKYGKIIVYFDISNYVFKKSIILISQIFILLTLIAILIIILNLYFDKLIIKPIYKIMDKMKSILTENYGVKIEIKQENEIGELAKIFNKMTQKLKNNVDSKEKILNELKISETYFRSIFDNIHSGLVVVNKNFEIIKYNKYFVNMFDLNEVNLYNYQIDKIFPFFNNYKENIVKNLINENNEEFVFEENYSGKILDIFCYKFSVYEEVNLIFLIDDVTLEKEKDERILNQQKLETVGILTNGIAHDFNNIVGEMTGNMFLLENQLNSKKINFNEVKDLINDLNSSISNAKDLINQLKGLSREKGSEKKICNFKDIIKRLEKILNRTVDKSITIKIKKPDQDIFLNCDKASIELALLNICINASHAMTIMRKNSEEWGGDLKIDISIVEGDIEKINDNFVFYIPDKGIKKRFCKIEIKDTGVGIKPENLDKIFDPLFTTKKGSTGTGFGLTMVKNTVIEHNGAIDVFSEVNKGTNFIVYLPLVEDKNVKYEYSLENNKMQKGSGKILVIDDEENILKITSKILKLLGYKIKSTKSPKEGINLYKKEQNKIDLVLVDLIMPELNGEMVIKRLKEINKDIKIVLMTGGIDERVEKIKNKYKIQILKKPFDIEMMSNIIYRTITNN